MSKQTASLAIVTEELSPARQDLANAIARRAAANAAVEQAAAKHRRVEAKVGVPDVLRQRIDQLQKVHTEILEKWTLVDDATPRPTLPHIAEIEQLQASLPQADADAAGARSALAKINSELVARQRDVSDAIELVRQRADFTIVELASALAAKLEKGELQTAAWRAQLLALMRFFELQGYARRQVGEPMAAIRNLINKSRGPYEAHPATVNQMVREWSDLATELFTDVNAELKEQSK